jgi:hypothetical protein
MTTRPTHQHVREVVRRWAAAQQFAWAERAAIIEEATGCGKDESEIRAWEMMTPRQVTLPVDLSGQS